MARKGAAAAKGGQPMPGAETGPSWGTSHAPWAEAVPVVDQDARQASAADKPAPEEVVAAVEKAPPAEPAPGELDVAHYQRLQLPEPRCWALVSVVWADMLGQQPAEVRVVSESLRSVARAFRVRLHKTAEGARQLQEPQDLAVVLMWPTASKREPHCGIYWRGSVLHATENAVLYEGLASVRDAYAVMEFWAR